MSQVFLTNQKLMGIKFNTTDILLLQCDIFTGNRVFWEFAVDAEQDVRLKVEFRWVWLDSRPLTATTKAAGRIPLLSVTQQTPILQLNPLLQRSSVWLESASHEMSAQPRAENHFISSCFTLHRLWVHLRDCSACLRKCLWRQPDIAGIDWVSD